jgi:hypothetical protein
MWCHTPSRWIALFFAPFCFHCEGGTGVTRPAFDDLEKAKKAAVGPVEPPWLSDLDESHVDLSRARPRGRPDARQVLKLEVG